MRCAGWLHKLVAVKRLCSAFRNSLQKCGVDRSKLCFDKQKSYSLHRPYGRARPRVLHAADCLAQRRMSWSIAGGNPLT